MSAISDRDAFFERRVLRPVGQAIADFDLIRDGDRIMVAVSGGKDSYVLLLALLELRRRAPIGFAIEAANLDPGYSGYRCAEVCDYVRSLGVVINQLKAPIDELVKKHIAPGSPACPLCSRVRRGALYTLCEQKSFGRLALGHHLDDTIETLWMNMCYAGQLRGMPPLIRRRAPPEVIRPLCYVPEADIRAFAEMAALPIVPCASTHCADADRRRQVIKRLLGSLEADHPDIKPNLRRALGNLVPQSLYAKANQT